MNDSDVTQYLRIQAKFIKNRFVKKKVKNLTFFFTCRKNIWDESFRKKNMVQSK